MGQLWRRQNQNRQQRNTFANSQFHKSLLDSQLSISKRASIRLQNQMMQLKQMRKKKKKNWYSQIIFSPQSTFVIVFNGILLILIYFYFLQIPITIAFGDQHRAGNQHFFQVINIISIIVFLAGILVKLKTSYYKEGILISNQWEIVKNYLKYQACLDIPSIFAIIFYQILIRNVNASDKTIQEERVIVLLVYLKVPQLIRIQQTIVSYLDLNRKTKAILKLILLQVKIFMLCNVAACGFFFISQKSCIKNNQGQELSCWIEQRIFQNIFQEFRDCTWSVKYVFSLYWASTTMMTIGYGDITPRNFNEAAYTVTAQFISCILFAFSINQVWSIIQQKNSKHNKIHSKLNVINVYMRDKNVGSNLKSRVNSYLSHFYHTKNLRQKQLQSQIMEQLTPVLRKQLCFQSYGFIFKNHLFFKNFSNQFLKKASQGIRQVGFFQQQLVYQPFSESKISLYYIFKGYLESYVQCGTLQLQNVVLQHYQKGCTVGLYQFVRQLNYCHSLKAIKYSLLYVLDYQSWSNALLQYEKDCQKFYLIKHKTQYKNNYKKYLQISCKICSCVGHQGDMCLQTQIQQETSDFLNRYLRETGRKNYPRKNVKTNIGDMKSHVNISFEPASSIKSVKARKASIMLSKKQIVRPQTLKKLIIQKNVHHQKMQHIILMQKLKQIQFSQSHHCQDLMTTILMRIQSVQNYQNYWPKMNATALDWCKDKMRITVTKRYYDNVNF